MRHTYCTEDAFREAAARHGASDFVWTEERDGPMHRFRLAALAPGQEFPIAEYTGVGTPDTWLWTERPRDRTVSIPGVDEDILTPEEQREIFSAGLRDGLLMLALFGLIVMLIVGLVP